MIRNKDGWNEHYSDKYLRVCAWLRKRYEVNPNKLVVSVGGKPTRYTRIEKAMFDRYLIAPYRENIKNE